MQVIKSSLNENSVRFQQSILLLFLLGIEDITRGAQELDNIIKQGYLEKKSKGIDLRTFQEGKGNEEKEG